jgi:hypothetical protein
MPASPSSRSGRTGIFAAVIAWLSLAAVAPAAHAALVYTASGGTVTGGPGGPGLIDVTWPITATDDAADVQIGLIAGVVPADHDFVSPMLSTDIAAGALTAHLLNVSSPDFTWATVSADVWATPAGRPSRR